ncbi:hypothetical protein [Streptomyces sp. PD-S100-1]
MSYDDNYEDFENDEEEPVLCECGASTDLLHDCDAADRDNEK